MFEDFHMFPMQTVTVNGEPVEYDQPLLVIE